MGYQGRCKGVLGEVRGHRWTVPCNIRGGTKRYQGRYKGVSGEVQRGIRGGAQGCQERCVGTGGRRRD